MSTSEEAPGGSIETLRFARLLARFWEQGFTGYFRARTTLRPAETTSKEILFERGRVAWAASDDPEESIRIHLINRGMLRPDQWLLAEEKAGSSQVRQTLLELGFLTARELQEADRERVTALVLSLFSWRDGRYEIAAGPLPHGTPNLKIDPRDLVLEGLMSSGDRGRVLDEIGSTDAVLIVRPDDLVRASLSLPVELVGLMGKADGTRTIADICALSPLSDFLISAAFAGLKVLGLARPVEGGVSAAPPAPPVPGPEKPPTRRRTTVGDAAARERAPLLPLYEPSDYETVPMAATPPGGVPKATRAADAPSAGTAAVAAGKAPPTSRPIAGAAAQVAFASASVQVAAASSSVPVAAAAEPSLPADDPDDSGTRPMPVPVVREIVPEPGVAAEIEDEPVILLDKPAAAASANPFEGRAEPIPMERTEGSAADHAGEAEDPTEEEGREAEVELRPGIPVAPHSLAHAGGSPLDEEEIEDAIHVLDAPADTGSERGEEEPIETSERFEAGDEMLDGDLDAEASGVEETEEAEAAAGDPPPWVYQPSEEPALAARSRRWATWGGLAAAIAGLGFGLVILFGGARGNPGEASPPPPSADRIPADVAPPPAFAPDPAPPQPSPDVAAASMTIPPAPVRIPEPPRHKPAAALAPAAAGSIFSSGSFKEGRRLLERGSFGEAASKFAAGVGGRKGLYTVQLALACETSTLTRAAGSTRGSTQFFILPTSYKGQACYRMLWGAYPNKSAAAGARGGVPPAFLKDPHPPVVAPL